MTSHAAVVARGMGKCCVAGAGDVRVNEEENYFEVKGVRYPEGSVISIDGSTGYIYDGAVPTVPASVSGDWLPMTWADKNRALHIRTNADTEDAKVAVGFGAEGIGLCRTEHMFFEADRIKAVREMILSDSEEEEEKALAKILPYQRQDFVGIFKEMGERPVTIRYLDPPLHEFLPHTDEEMVELAKEMGVTLKVKDTVQAMHEFNPMLGHRGCRLPITYPEIAEMQTRAVIEAAIIVNKEDQDCSEIMIPLVGEVKIELH